MVTALGLARNIVAHLNRPKRVDIEVQTPEDPLYDPAELYGIVSSDLRKPL